MQNRWFHPPSLHSPGPGRERRVGWLELFYDLIYVDVISRLDDGRLLVDYGHFHETVPDNVASPEANPPT